jgi:DNA repair exonuclease SbcCD ATPase subunit
MLKYLKALWLMVTGRFTAAAEALQENRHVMAATFDASIKKGADRFGTVKNAVAELMGIKQNRVQEIKTLTERAEKQQKIKNGAKVLMQKRINQLRQEGKSKEECQMDGEFIRHSGAYKDASSTLAEIEENIEGKEEDLKLREAQIAKYKAELQAMQRNQQKLKEEKHEALADVAVSQSLDEINSTLAGITDDSTDKDLAAARAARKRVTAKAQISAELTGNDAKVAENEYLDMAVGSEADAELDGLLNWGDEDTGDDLTAAKLPEG